MNSLDRYYAEASLVAWAAALLIALLALPH
jgi:hypothetical protein